MDPVLKSQWVADLRSGEYQQGKGALRTALPDDEYEYCCLGVLCDRLIKNGREDIRWDDDFIVFHLEDFFGEESDHPEHSQLPEALLNDLNWNTEQVPQSNLIYKNDGELGGDGEWIQPRFTFEEIADFIESVNL